MIEVNNKILDLELLIDDKIIKISELKFKYLILYFYPKDLTSGCSIEAKAYNDLLPEFNKLDTLVLGVSSNNKGSHSKFINKLGLNFKLVDDVDQKLGYYFDTYKEKSMYGKKYLGYVRSTFIINHNLEVLYVNYKANSSKDAITSLDFIKSLN